MEHKGRKWVHCYSPKVLIVEGGLILNLFQEAIYLFLLVAKEKTGTGVMDRNSEFKALMHLLGHR